jgi:hypothetical protein
MKVPGFLGEGKIDFVEKPALIVVTTSVVDFGTTLRVYSIQEKSD